MLHCNHLFSSQLQYRDERKKPRGNNQNTEELSYVLYWTSFKLFGEFCFDTHQKANT